jgi:hypothetical protein
VVLSTYPVISDVRPRPSSSHGRNKVLSTRNQGSAFDPAQSICTYLPSEALFLRRLIAHLWSARCGILPAPETCLQTERSCA